jgi:benzoyl-CoA reductase subunit C
MTRPTSVHFFTKELEILRRSLEGFTGKSIADQDIQQAIQLHNEVRGLLRDLYRLRSEERPRVSGSETMKIMLDGFGLPVSDYKLLLKNTVTMVKARPTPPSTESVRLLVYGAEVDDASLLELMEQCGATVVMDDLCTGSRGFWQDVELTSNPLEGLAKHYLLDTNCPRTYKPRYGDYYKDMENRFGYLKGYVEEFLVNGVIMYIMRYCDSHEFDAPDLKVYLQRLGVPVIFLENEYSMSSTEQLRSRVEAFVEMIG